jgi:RNA polymerase sigma factor (sigma-70 family)
VEDRDLAAALVAGRPGTPLGSQALAALYDTYADRLFAYAVSVLRDRDLAADALHDALLVAHDRAEQLRDPGRLRAWLFAITRNECLRILRARSRYADQEEATDMPDTTVDLDAGLAREEAAALVAAGMGALSATDRDVLALALRHDLDPSDVSAALGVSANQAHARLSRARASLERAIGAVLLARTRGRDCPELAAILAAASVDGSDASTHDEGTGAGAAAGLDTGPSASAGAGADARDRASAGAGADASDRASAGAVVMTPLLRKRVARHAESCEVCERDRRRGIAALAPAFAVPAALTAPADLRARLLDPVLGEGDPHALDVTGQQVGDAAALDQDEDLRCSG